jgi:hypothetical protein
MSITAAQSLCGPACSLEFPTPSEPCDLAQSPSTLGNVDHPFAEFAGAEDVQGELDTQAAALLLQTDVETTRSKASNTFRHKYSAK